MHYRYLILLLPLIFSCGCSTTNLHTYDENGFTLDSTRNLKMSTKLVTGQIKSGHSDWVSTSDFDKGIYPKYNCIQQSRHTSAGVSWMYELTDQDTFIENLNKVLISNELYDENSDNQLQIDFVKIEQGPNRKMIYTFDVVISLVMQGNEVYRANHHVIGNKDNLGKWSSFDGISAQKKISSNELMEIIINDFNEWLKNRKQ